MIWMCRAKSEKIWKQLKNKVDQWNKNQLEHVKHAELKRDLDKWYKCGGNSYKDTYTRVYLAV